jgi:hypothetical protein
MRVAVSIRQLRIGQPPTRKDSVHRAAFCMHFPLFKAEPRCEDLRVELSTKPLINALHEEKTND